MNRSERIEELSGWWAEQAREEIAKMAPKAVEYSSYDLDLIGRITQDMTAADPGVSPAELACWWYLIGKVGRAVGVLRTGGRPSDDTILDLGIYARMIQRIRYCGGWPDGEEGPL